MRFHFGLGVGHSYGLCSKTSTHVKIGSQDKNQEGFDEDDDEQSNPLHLSEAAGEFGLYEETDSDDSSFQSEGGDSEDHVDDNELLVMADMYRY